MSSANHTLAALAQRIRQLESARRGQTEAVSTGSAELDRLLPGGGLQRGTLVEWLGIDGGGAGALALVAAREACRQGGALVVVDRGRWFYPPAAANLGIDLETTVILRPQNRSDELWALHQALSCSSVAAVWWPVDQLDDHAFRRLQLAAESGGTLALFLRPPAARGQPTWSDVQLLVEPREKWGVGKGEWGIGHRAGRSPNFPAVKSDFLPHHVRWGRGKSAFRHLRIELLRARGGKPGATVELELDHETGDIQPSRRPARGVHLASAVAVAAPRRRSPGA